MIELERNQSVGAGVGVVASGALAIRRELSDGRRVLSSLLHQGDIAELQRDGRNCQGELVAVAASRFLAFGLNQYNACLANHIRLATTVATRLREQAARMCDHAADLAGKTPLERVASVLFEFKRWPEGQPAADRPDNVSLPLQRADIADYLGLQPETVSRSFRQLEHEGLLRALSSEMIEILDIPGLRRIANGGRPRKSTRSA